MNIGYKKLYIDGELRDAAGGERFEVICPGTAQPAGEIAWASKADADRALESAAAAFERWSRVSLAERTRWMHKLRDAVVAAEDRLREAVMFEMGKPWAGTAEDYQTVVNALNWYPEAMARVQDEPLADEDGTHRHVLRSEPLGVAVAFLAWNFPLLNVGFKLGPALAAGCTLIIRPSSSAPLSAYVLGEVLHEVGFPNGVVNILCGPTDPVGTTLVRSGIPRLITLIGSSSVGRKLIAESATSVKRVSMELGGNAPALVFDDADLEQAAKDLCALKFGNTGQICVAPNRFFVHRQVAAEFEALVVERAKAVRIGFGREHEPTMGPLINAAACARMAELVADAVGQGAELVYGGKAPDKPEQGHYFEPTILRNVTPEMRVFREEIFGPILAMRAFEDEQAVLAEANDTEYGLASYLFTTDADRIRRISDGLAFGEVMVNGFKYAIYLPHGGIKESGIGHDCSHLALHDYLVKKRVTEKTFGVG